MADTDCQIANENAMSAFGYREQVRQLGFQMNAPLFIKLWQQVEQKLGLSPSDLIAASNVDFFRRVYCSRDRVLKVVLTSHETSGRLRRNTLKQEYEILQSCEGVVGVPRAREFISDPLADILILNHEDAKPASSLDLNLIEALVVTVRMIPIQIGLVARGICHNDLDPANILVSKRGQVSIIDFDQASKHHPVVAAVRIFFGIPLGKVELHNSLPSFFISNLKRILGKLTPAAIKRIRKMHRSRSSLPTLGANTDKRLRLLRDAWVLARASEASAPGAELAYYDYVFNNNRFPGERPWAPRWACLSALADYSGKRVMELGCNIGLLSSFLLREKNCAAVLGVDLDSQILDAARMVAEALDVSPKFQQVNFDDPVDWESDLVSFQPDIVFALNVLNWVKDKDRFLAFLGRFDELIFEGHESFEVEKTRLFEAGFRNIRMVDKTERGRDVLYCAK